MLKFEIDRLEILNTHVFKIHHVFSGNMDNQAATNTKSLKCVCPVS